MKRKETSLGGPRGPLAALRRIIPFEPDAASHGRGWRGLEAARYCAVGATELNPPGISCPRLVLFVRPPDKLDVQYEGVKRHLPPPAGSISLVPAGSPVQWVWSGRFDWLHVVLEPRLLARVAAPAFGLDPARLTVPPLDGLDLPRLRAVMAAVNAELTVGGGGGPLAAESLANLLAVHLVRHSLGPGGPAPGRDGALPRIRLRAVIEYIEEHLDAGATLEQMSAVARLSRTRANFLTTSSASSASPRVNSAPRQRTPNRPQVPSREAGALPLSFS